MKSEHLALAFLLALPCLNLTNASGRIQEPEAKTKPAPLLTVVSLEGVRSSKIGVGASDFGSIDPLTTDTATRTYLLKNETKKPIYIGRLRGSCGCQSLRLLQKKVEVPQVLLEPDEAVSVEGTINLRGLHGALRKTIWVYGVGKEPIATLEMTGSVREAIYSSPRTLNFGAGPSGAARTQVVTISADERTLSKNGFPPLASDSHDISIASEGETIRLAIDGAAYVQQNYRVTLLSTATNGGVTGSLHFQTPARATIAKKDASSEKRTESRSERLLSELTIPMTGQVKGNLSATPQGILFGSVSLPSGLVRRSILTGKSLEELEKLKIVCDNPAFLVALAKPESGADRGASATCLLEVRISPVAKPGVIHGCITLSTPGGERVAMSVSADVHWKSG